MAEFNLNVMEARERYHLMTRIVGPRPIALVSSLSADGIGNLAPFSYFNLGGANPPSAFICPSRDRRAGFKDTLLNIEETGEYVINAVTIDMAEKMSKTSWAYPRDVDEFDMAGFTRADSTVVKPPRVAESPINMEMKLYKIIKHGEGPLSSNYIIGEIVHVHVDDDRLTDGLPDNEKLDYLGRLGGEYYTKVTRDSLVKVPRPTGPNS